jgi:hypothetical protein
MLINIKFTILSLLWLILFVSSWLLMPLPL